MSANKSDFEESCSVSEPFHGDVWFGISRQASEPIVRLAVSLKTGWDVDIRLDAHDARTLAEALG
jgi:hypothetical protein